MTALMIVIVGLCAVLAAGCATADKLFPRIRPVERWIRRLPLAKIYLDTMFAGHAVFSLPGERRRADALCGGQAKKGGGDHEKDL